MVTAGSERITGKPEITDGLFWLARCDRECAGRGLLNVLEIPQKVQTKSRSRPRHRERSATAEPVTSSMARPDDEQYKRQINGEPDHKRQRQVSQIPSRSPIHNPHGRPHGGVIIPFRCKRTLLRCLDNESSRRPKRHK